MQRKEIPTWGRSPAWNANGKRRREIDTTDSVCIVKKRRRTDEKKEKKREETNMLIEYPESGAHCECKQWKFIVEDHTPLFMSCVYESL